MDRRTRLEDTRQELESQTYNLFPERWHNLYFPRELQEVNIDGEEMEEVTSIEDLDRFFDEMDAKQSMTGTDVFEFQPTIDFAHAEWGDWT